MSDKIKVGQELYIVPTGNLVRSYGKDIRKGVVTKVGHKYLYVKIEGVYSRGEGSRFDRKTLRCECWHNSAWLAFCSMQEIKDKKEASQLWREFRQFFSGWQAPKKLTLKQMRDIKMIIDEENE